MTNEELNKRASGLMRPQDEAWEHIVYYIDGHYEFVNSDVVWFPEQKKLIDYYEEWQPASKAAQALLLIKHLDSDSEIEYVKISIKFQHGQVRCDLSYRDKSGETNYFYAIRKTAEEAITAAFVAAMEARE